MLLDRHLKEANVKLPVVVKSDGHSSQFEFKVLEYCRDHQIGLFISPRNTTAVTQDLDQINQKLHSSYRSAKANVTNLGKI